MLTAVLLLPSVLKFLIDGSDAVWCCLLSLLAPFRTITHPFLPKINFNFHCMYTTNALLSIDPVSSTPWLTCCRPVDPDRRIGHPWCNTSTVLLCWFLFYCISILSTWWPSWMIAFNFFPPMLFLWWSPVFAVSNVMNQRQISEMKPPQEIRQRSTGALPSLFTLYCC